MKKISLLLLLNLFYLCTDAQNVFPSNGNVLIGNTLDLTSQKLQVNGVVDITGNAGGRALRFYDGTNFTGGIGNNLWALGGSAWDLGLYTPNNIILGSNGYERLRISSNGNVGIGTVEPSSKLHVFGGDFLVNGGQGDRNSGIRIVAPVATSHYNWMIGANQNVNATFEITPSTVVNGTTFSVPAIAINANGNIGVGTNSPVPIGGACRTLGVNSTTDSYSGGISYMANGVIKGFSYYDNGAMALQGAAGVPVKIITNNTEQVRVDVSGYMGLGTANPTERLTVNGNIKTKKIIVTQTGWADYVFKDDYKLKPLQEVASYIKVHKRLPEVPSAKEVEEKGVSIGDTQALLLKKIEELTLYVISLQNQVNELKKKTSKK